MKKTTPGTWTGLMNVCLAVLLVFLAHPLLASPSEEITKAVSADGATNVKQASPDRFLDAFATVLVGADKNNSAAYVSAAVKLRPDLKDSIVATAKEINSPSVDAPATDNQMSPHHRKCKICCNGHTFTLPCHAARRHLQQHPECTRGPCPP
jgi:hypothetical protein